MNSIDKDISPWETEATITYLTNPVYKTTVSKKQPTMAEVNKNFNKDKKFYRKRIMEITRNMFKGKIADKCIKSAFDDYVNTCICHLKTLDTTDIIQSDYPPDLTNKPVPENVPPLNLEQTTQQTMGKRGSSVNILEKLVTRTNNATQESPPVKKSINLNEPALRHKGIKLKKQKQKQKI